jgi:hypothetical protein
MTTDTFTMEAVHLIDRPTMLMKLVRRMSSAKRNEQLQDIIINGDDASLSYRVYIKMLMGPENRQDIFIDSFQVPVYSAGSSASMIVNRCLKLMEAMAKGVDEC